MRHYEERIVPEHTEQRLSHVTCDICGDEIKKEMYDATEMTIEMRTGSSYPEGGYGEKIEYDLCDECFKSKLMPWLEKKGAKREWEDWDW